MKSVRLTPPRVATVARLARRRISAMRRNSSGRANELAFLPAALEIAETPPSPIGRAIGATIILLFCAAVWSGPGWARSISSLRRPEKSCRAAAPRSSSRSRPGSCAPFGSHDGQAVKAGDVLIELDPTVNAAERDHLHSDLLAEQLNIARLARGARRRRRSDGRLHSRPPMQTPALISAQRHLLLNQVTEHRAKIAALDRQQAQKEAEQATTAATIHKLEAMIPVIQQRVDIRKTLMDKELGSKLTYFETLQQLVEQQEDLGVQKSHLHEAEAARPRFTKRAPRPRPNIGARSPTNSPRPSRRRAGSPRT